MSATSPPTYARLLHTLARWTLAMSAAALTFEVVVKPIYSLHIVSDPEFGPIVAPGSTVHFGLEGWGTSHWGSRGVRGERASLDGAPPILAVGDSQTESFMVDDDVVFTAKLEGILAKNDPSLRVLNVGKSNHSVADYVGLAPRYIAAFHPRWTVIEVRDKDLGSDAWVKGKRHFASEPGGELTVVDVPEPARHGVGKLFWETRQRSSFVGYSVVRFGRFREAMAREAPLFHAGTPSAARPEGDPAERLADYPLEAELAALRDAWGGRLTILLLADFDPHDPGRVSEIGRWLAERCAATGISFVTLGSASPDFLARGHSPYGFGNTKFNDGHMNVEGHAAVAELLARELERVIKP
jgi:hypothetical protein